MEEKIKEIMKLVEFHGFDVEEKYPDGSASVTRAITIEELHSVLIDVLGEEEK